jgi:hypothetical protein
MICWDQEDKCIPDTIQELERERQGIFRQIDELWDFRAGSITPTAGQNPDKPDSEQSDDGKQWGRRLFNLMQGNGREGVNL